MCAWSVLVQQRILSTFIVRTLATAPQQSITVELSNRLWRMVETQSRQITRNINCADKPYASTNTLSQPQNHLNAASTAQTQITVGAAEGCDLLILIHQTRGTRQNHRRLRNTSATKSTSSNHREANTNAAVRSSPTQTKQTKQTKQTSGISNQPKARTIKWPPTGKGPPQNLRATGLTAHSIITHNVYYVKRPVMSQMFMMDIFNNHRLRCQPSPNPFALSRLALLLKPKAQEPIHRSPTRALQSSVIFDTASARG